MSGRANGSGGPDEVVARAIKELIDSVPGEEEAPPPEVETSTAQPWAETASPSANDKRPLEMLLSEYAARVAAAPGAMAQLSTDAHPSKTFYDRFARSPAPAGSGRRRRRRVSGRKRRGGAGREHQPG
jgi:hypothetical protein